jgi:hypothetical protein
MKVGISLKKIVLLSFSLFFMTVSLASDKEAPEIRTLMAPEDFTAAGLDKLTDAEREHLSGWVARYREGAIKGPAVPGKERKEAAAAAEAAAESGQDSSRVAAEDGEPETTDEYPEEYVTQAEKREKKKKKENVTFELRAKVIPEFRGWSGKTVFSLDNGQVWRQRTPGKLRYSKGDSNVIITQNFLGKFIMEHEATGRAIGVRRID